MTDTVANDTPNAPAISSGIPEAELTRLTDEIVGALKSVYDPEIPSTSMSSASSTRWTSPTTAPWPSR